MSNVLGIIGCGNIGSALAKAASELKEQVEKIILYDEDKEKTVKLEKELSDITVATSSGDVINSSDLVVEAVAPHIVEELLKLAIQKGKNIMFMSIGGLAGKEELLDKAREKGVRIILPSGAVCGIDGLKAAKQAGINSVTLTTRKPPKSLAGAPYLKDKNIDIENLQGETVIFEGTASEAIKVFPKNINVSVLLSLAGIGPDRTKVKILTSPEYTKNTHEVEIRGNSGTIITRTENVPSPQNPKTSYLAVLSAITTLKEYFDPVQIGT